MDPTSYYFPIYKGIQKPLEFMGLRGRFISLAAVGVGISFLGFCIGAILISQIVGIGVCVFLVLTSYLYLILKQKQGLHSKKKCKDILVYHYLFIRK